MMWPVSGRSARRALRWRFAGSSVALPDLSEPSAGHRLITDGTPAHVRNTLAILESIDDSASRSLAAVAVVLMAGAAEDPPYCKHVRLLFDTNGREQAGRTGTLQLAVLAGGPTGLYPDPRTMLFLRTDQQFTDALTAAWILVHGDRSEGPCVLWSVAQEGGRIEPDSRRLSRCGCCHRVDRDIGTAIPEVAVPGAYGVCFVRCVISAR